MTGHTPSSVLVFSRTTGYRHEAVEAGVDCIVGLGREHGFRVDATEDPTRFDDAQLAGYDVVVWMQVSGIVLDDAQRAAYERFTARGGGFAGVHAASDAERDWPLYDRLVGARFESHPPGVSERVLRRTGVDDPSTAGLPDEWRWTDEWYHFDRDPRIGSEILLTVSADRSGQGQAGQEEDEMDDDYPVTWRRTVGDAHAWYTSLGHLPAAFSQQPFREHLLGGLVTAAGGAR